MSKLRCPSCGSDFQLQVGYACVRCGQHFDRLYRREHRDPRRARTMTRAEIAAEYRAAGVAPLARTHGQPHGRRLPAAVPEALPG